jgi:hypothetical protein
VEEVEDKLAAAVRRERNKKGESNGNVQEYEKGQMKEAPGDKRLVAAIHCE